LVTGRVGKGFHQVTTKTEGPAMTDTGAELGVDPATLDDEDIFRELASLYRARLATLRHGPDAALDNHFRRTAALETEYMARYPGREVDPSRLTQAF
jgi:hypothetical protein